MLVSFLSLWCSKTICSEAFLALTLIWKDFNEYIDFYHFIYLFIYLFIIIFLHFLVTTLVQYIIISDNSSCLGPKTCHWVDGIDWNTAITYQQFQ